MEVALLCVFGGWGNLGSLNEPKSKWRVEEGGGRREVDEKAEFLCPYKVWPYRGQERISVQERGKERARG